jgi:hypothetical protein
MIQILYMLLSTSVFFSVTSSFFFLSPFKHLIYFHLFISPFLSLSLCTSLSSTLSPSISLFVPMFVYLSQSLYFFFLLSLSPFVTLSAIVFSTLIYYLSLCVSLTSIDYIFPSFFVYTTFLSPSHVHRPSMFVFSFSFFFSIFVCFWFFLFLSLLLWSIASQ